MTDWPWWLLGGVGIAIGLALLNYLISDDDDRGR